MLPDTDNEGQGRKGRKGAEVGEEEEKKEERRLICRTWKHRKRQFQKTYRITEKPSEIT
jgi:hypothetical protein